MTLREMAAAKRRIAELMDEKDREREERERERERARVRVEDLEALVQQLRRAKEAEGREPEPEG